ncbi:MAG: prolyl oligopeptidase family serine peptidase [Actinobacteria bacterium]|nr:prolyl oligopeptidase family serine peptidase [Actinomycetota bacterium]
MMGRRALVAALTVLLAAAVLGACASDRSAQPASGGRSTTTSKPAAAPSGSCRRANGGAGGAIGDHAVGRADRTVVDTSRATVAPQSLADRAAPSRTLPLVVLYPAKGSGDTSGAATAGAAPSTDGPFPLLVHSHGLGGWGDERIETLARWASAGYVVVAPTFPLSSRSSDPSDLANQPADVSFVVQQIRAAAASGSDVLHGLVRADCVALSGHSLGGGTAMSAAYDTCCTSIHPDAVVDIAGVLVDRTPTAQLSDMAPIPVLLVHGDADQRVPYAQSERKVQLLHGPTWFLTFTGGGHSDMFTPPRSTVLDEAVVAFLDAQLQGSPGRLEELPRVVQASGLATLQVLAQR